MAKDKRIGNQFWKLADPDKMGAPLNFKGPKELWDACCLYFEECDENPLKKEETTTTDKGNFYKTTEFKVPYTWEGLYVSLGVCNLEYLKTHKDFSKIITHIGNVIRNQKLTGAIAGIFNANIVARELGLADKKEITKKKFKFGYTDGEE